MLPEPTRMAAGGAPLETNTSALRSSISRTCQRVSTVCFLAAALAMVAAGATMSAGQESSSALVATLSYAMALGGIFAGVAGLVSAPRRPAETIDDSPEQP